tara:strand:- start:224 stop:640 length:417 start_codon:yes stop_codon:yes gene_type:complete
MRVDYHHIPEENALIEQITGEVTLEGLIAMKKEEQERNYLNSSVRILSVFLDAKILLSVGDIKALGKWQTENNQRQKGGQTALLATEPVAIALNLFYSRETKSIRRMEVFSTYTAALKWLELDVEILSKHWKGFLSLA